MSTETPTNSAEEQAPAPGCGSTQGSSCSSGQSAEGSCSSGAAQESLAQLQPPPQIQEFVTDPNAADAVIKLTEGAAKEIQRFMVEKNVPEEAVLRIAVAGGG